MKNFFKNLLHGKYPFRGRSSRNMKCVYAGPEDPRMNRGKSENAPDVPQEPQIIDDSMKCVYAGPDGPWMNDAGMKPVYAGPEDMRMSEGGMKLVYAGPQDPRMSEGGMKLVYAGPPVKDAEAPKPLEETGTEEQDTPVVNV